MSHQTATTEASDRRVRRTQAAIHSAFSSLFLERGLDAIAVGDIAERANVSRSTFYQYFSGKEEVLCATLRPMLQVLADAVSERRMPELLAMVIEHFWANRQLGRAILTGTAKQAVIRMLADEIEQRLSADGPAPRRLLAVHLATAQLALIEEWLSGRYRFTPQALAEALFASSRAAAAALAGICVPDEARAPAKL